MTCIHLTVPLYIKDSGILRLRYPGKGRGSGSWSPLLEEPRDDCALEDSAFCTSWSGRRAPGQIRSEMLTTAGAQPSGRSAADKDTVRLGEALQLRKLFNSSLLDNATFPPKHRHTEKRHRAIKNGSNT